MPTTYHTLIRSDDGISWVIDSQTIGDEAHPPTFIHKSKNDVVEGPWLIGSPYGDDRNTLWSSDDGTDFEEIEFTHAVTGVTDNGDGFWTLIGYGFVDTEARNGIWIAEDDDVSAFANITPYTWVGYGDPATVIPSVVDALLHGSRALLASYYGGGDPYLDAIFTSDDSETWTRVAIDFGTPLSICTDEGSRFVAGAFTAADSTVGVGYSDDDGDTWTEGTISDNGQLWSIAYSPALSLWVGVGNDITGATVINTWTSSDGEDWTSGVSLGASVAMSKVIWNDALDLFVAVGTKYGEGDLGVVALVATSPDGVTWTPRTVPGVGGLLYGVDTDSSGQMYAVGIQVTEDAEITELEDDPVEMVISFGSVAGSATVTRNTKLTVTDDKSTAPHGFYFQVKIVEDIATLTLSDPDDSSWQFKMILSGGFLKDDVIYGSSDFNNQYLYLHREDTIYTIVSAITTDSNWPLIFPGDNKFVWDPVFVEWVQIWYYPTYWGV